MGDLLKSSFPFFIGRWVIVALMACAGSSLFLLCIPAIWTPHDLSHPESIVPWAVREIAANKPLYADWRQWPHRFMPYGPLLCYPAGLIFRALHMEEFGFHLYLAGRIQSLVYMVGVGALLANMLRIAGIRFGWGLLYSFAILALWPGIFLPGMSFRADLPALFWVLAAATLAFQFPANRNRLAVALAMFMISLAYRPALWSFPAAFALFAFWRTGIIPAVRWCVAVVVAAGAYIVVGNFLTDGRFLLNQAGASSIGFTADTYRLAFVLLTGPQEFPIFTWDIVGRLLTAAIASMILLKKSKSHFDHGLSIYFLTALFVNLLTMFKVGSAFNYIVEAYVLSAVVLAIGALRLKENWASVGKVFRAGSLATGALMFVVPMLWFTIINVSTVPQVYQIATNPSPLKPLLNLPGSALLGDLAFVHPSEPAHALSDPVPYVQLTGQGKISREPLTSRLKARAFSHVVLSPGTKYLFFAPDRALWAGKALEAYYTQQVVAPGYEIWVPSNGETSAPAEVLPPHLSE